jgi:decaprenylphospho-beta-D-erythro-pentofuranosid-2-ulose 2-reductase
MRDGVGDVQSVLVLGGTSDIGLAIARALIERRVRRVILAGRNETTLALAADLLRGDRAIEVATEPFDVDQVDAHDAWFAEVFQRHGDVDVVVLAAGVLGDPDDAHHRATAAAAVLHTNLVGGGAALIAVAEQMRGQGHGTLVVLSSVAGERARRANFVYGASKAGLDALAQGLGDALAVDGTGVHVVIVRPGFVTSKMTRGMKPAPLATMPDAVAAAVVTAIRTHADVIWVPSRLRVVMAVVRHLPRRVFRRLPL